MSHCISSVILQWSGLVTGVLGLAISAVTLWFLIRYVRATDVIARQAALQVEVSERPAIIVKQVRDSNDYPEILNIGNGPALDVSWSIIGTSFRGVFSYLLPEGPDKLRTGTTGGLKALHESGLVRKNDIGLVECRYRSLSGRKYISRTSYDTKDSLFSTVFEEQI